MIRVRSAVVLVAAVCAVAGCSAGDDASAAPPPKAELVAWSQTVCDSVSTLGSVKADYADVRGYGAAAYGSYVRAGVQTVLDDLDKLAPSRISQADSFATSLQRELRTFRDELPEEGAAGKAPTVKHVDEQAAKIAKRQAELTKLARRTSELAPSYHLAPACDALRPAPELATPATRTFLEWTNAACEIQDAVAEPPSVNRALAEHPRFAPHESYVLQDYLDTVGQLAEDLGKTAKSMPKTKVGKADTLASELAATLADLRERSGVDDDTPAYDKAIGQVRKQVEEGEAAVTGLTRETDGIAGVTNGHRGLQAAAELAPACGKDEPEPEKTLPEANNGTDVGACGDGTCEIAVSKPMDVKVGVTTFTLTVTGGSLWIVSDGMFMQLGVPAEGQFGVSDGTVLFTMDEANDDEGVVKVSRG